MPGSLYLQSGEYTAYGLSGSTDPNLVQQAANLIDMHLKRPEGLVWSPDWSGQPCYMTAALPVFTLKLSAPIAPGANVVAQVTGATQGLQVGDVLIADRSTSNITEALVIQAIQGQNLTFRSVGQAHAAQATLESDMVITEQRFMPKLRPVTHIARTPVQRVIAGTGRYGYGRRGEMATSEMDDFNLLASLQKFGGPPVWEVFDPNAVDFDAQTGQLWVPAGIMLAYYTEVRVRYVAGFPASAIPYEVKQACAMLANTLIQSPNLGAVKSYSAGGTNVQRFADTMISGDVRDMLEPYRARTIA